MKFFTRVGLLLTLACVSVLGQNAIAANVHPSARYFTQPRKTNIRGIVTDDQGKAIPGAVVREKGTTNKTVTKSDGTFELYYVKENAVLIITYVGYSTREIKVRNTDEVLTIFLTESQNSLNEVAVISTGYQKIKKDQLTGAASTITAKQYHQREAVTGNFLESLEGKVPGLVYNPKSGDLSIRGVATFDAVKQPLIVLDGFPTEINLRTINPNDIVSVSVLRDAAAASIYGVRASNGVIVIETRRGKSGKTVFNFRSTYAFQGKPDFSYLNYAPASEFVQLQRDYFNIAKPPYSNFQYGFWKMNPVQEILFGATQTDVSDPLLSADQVNAKLAELGAYDNLKDYENLFFRKRQAQNINFDWSGGTERSTYILGMNYIGEIPLERRSDNKQFILNFANTYKFSDRFNFDFKGTYTNGKNSSGNIPPYSDFFPYEHLTDGNGNALPVSLAPGREYSDNKVTNAVNQGLIADGLYDQFYYPYRELVANTTTDKTNSVRFQGRLNARITEWLNVDLGGNYESQNLQSDTLAMESAFKTRLLLNASAITDPSTGKAMFYNMPKGSILKRNSMKLSNYTVRGQLNFAHKFGSGEHDFSGILGAERKRTFGQSYLTSYFGYNGQTLIAKPVNLLEMNAISEPEFTDVGAAPIFRSQDYFNQKESDRRFMSYYGQGTYIFKGKYVATGSFRIDKSNLFGVDPKYRNKPLWSVGANWRLGEEPLIKQLDWIDNLQIRAATGFNGNVPTSNNGAFLILTTGLYPVPRIPVPYNDVITPENQSLRWETTKNYNLGMDYSLWNGHLWGSIDWYLKKTTDVFGRYDADPTSGFNLYNANTASIQNKGLEFLINSVNLRSSGFQWSTQLTASFNSSKVLKVKEKEYSDSESIVTARNSVQGYPLGALFSYNYGGLNAVGQPYVLDKNGQQRVLAFYGSSPVDVTKDDLIYNGTTTPKYVLGLNNQFSLGNFDLSFLFMYYGGHVMRVEQPDPNSISSDSSSPLLGSGNFWRTAGDEKNTIIPGFASTKSSSPGFYQLSALYGYQYASQFVRKADYIRLRDVVLTYRVKAKFIDQLGLRNVQVRAQAQNAFRYTFSGNKIDPDAIDPLTGVRSLETKPFYSLTLSTNF